MWFLVGEEPEQVPWPTQVFLSLATVGLLKTDCIARFDRGDVYGTDVGLGSGLANLASVELAAPSVAVENPDPSRTYFVDCQGELVYKPKEIVTPAVTLVSTTTR